MEHCCMQKCKKIKSESRRTLSHNFRFWCTTFIELLKDLAPTFKPWAMTDPSDLVSPSRVERGRGLKDTSWCECMLRVRYKENAVRARHTLTPYAGNKRTASVPWVAWQIKPRTLVDSWWFVGCLKLLSRDTSAHTSQSVNEKLCNDVWKLG